MIDIVEQQMKRQEHLQVIVQRLAGNSFLIKGWAITLATAILGLALSNLAQVAPLAYVEAVPTLVFWGLDAYYLATEREARELYNAGADAIRARLVAPTTAQTVDLPPAFIRITEVGFRLWLKAMWSPSVWILYLLLIFGAFAVGSGLFGHIVKSVPVWV